MKEDQVYLPKIGWIPFFKSRETAGKICQATITEKAGHWYIAITCEIDIDPPVNIQEGVGIDRGIKTPSHYQLEKTTIFLCKKFNIGKAD